MYQQWKNEFGRTMYRVTPNIGLKSAKLKREDWSPEHPDVSRLVRIRNRVDDTRFPLLRLLHNLYRSIGLKFKSLKAFSDKRIYQLVLKVVSYLVKGYTLIFKGFILVRLA